MFNEDRMRKITRERNTVRNLTEQERIVEETRLDILMQVEVEEAREAGLSDEDIMLIVGDEIVKAVMGY